MTEKTDITIGDAMAAAFQAILREDYTARDQMVALVQRQMGERPSAPLDEVIILGDKSGH